MHVCACACVCVQSKMGGQAEGTTDTAAHVISYTHAYTHTHSYRPVRAVSWASSFGTLPVSWFSLSQLRERVYVWMCVCVCAE